MAILDKMDKFAGVLHKARFEYAYGWKHPVSKRGIYQLHSHQDCELVYHRSGRGMTSSANGESQSFSPGALIIYPPGFQHSQKMDIPGEDCCVIFKIEGISQDIMFDHPLYVDDATRFEPDIEILINPALQIPEVKKMSYDHRIAALFLEIVELLRVAGNAGENKTQSQIYIQKTLSLIQKNFGMPYETEDIAREIGVSSHYIRHIFREHVGVGIKEYLIRTRMKRAQELLQYSQMPVKAVSGACGYSCERYFCSAFRKWSGVAPGGFRKQRGLKV